MTDNSNQAIRILNLIHGARPNGPKALDNLSLSVRGGEKVAICGRSGSGKSTLFQALFRMIDISAGKIVVDGLDVATLPREVVRSRLGSIPQEPFLLSGSVRTNLDPRGIASTEDMTRLLCEINLLSIVEKMGGLDGALDHEALSPGQRQIFCLARAMLSKSSIVAIDEATAR